MTGHTAQSTGGVASYLDTCGLVTADMVVSSSIETLKRWPTNHHNGTRVASGAESQVARPEHNNE
jgi:hypothetical protein